MIQNRHLKDRTPSRVFEFTGFRNGIGPVGGDDASEGGFGGVVSRGGL